MQPEPLPGILQDIADALGHGVALRFADAFGGQSKLKLPSRPRSGDRLSTAVGFDNAVKIVQLLGAGEISVPMGPSSSYNSQRRRTAETITRLDKSGCSAGEIARRVGVTERTIHNHRRRRRGPDPRQRNLF